MNERLSQAFEECLKGIEDGRTIDECLLRYPDIAGELRPSLEAAIIAGSLSTPEVPSFVINRSRSKVLAYSVHLISQKKIKFSFMRYPIIATLAVLIALVVILGSREIAIVSAESLPGDSLYPLKRVVEDIRVRFTPNQDDQYQMEIQYREQHIQEVQEILDRGWIRMVTFEGEVQQLTPSKWIVDNIQVNVTSETIVVGDIHLGSVIEVEGITTPDGWIQAHELHLREYQFIGQVKLIRSDFWIISGYTFEIIPVTQIDSSIQVGDTVLTLARSSDSGAQDALAILRLPNNISSAISPEKDNTSLIAGKQSDEEFEISGIVQSISATEWVVDGYSVNINLNTQMDDFIALGDYVTVDVLLNSEGSLIALRVEMSSSDIDDRQENDSGKDEINDRGDDDNDDKESRDEDSNQDKSGDDQEQSRDDSDELNQSDGSDDDTSDDGGDRSGSNEDDSNDGETDENSDNSGSGSDEESENDDEEPEEHDDDDEPENPDDTDEPDETDETDD